MRAKVDTFVHFLALQARLGARKNAPSMRNRAWVPREDVLRRLHARSAGYAIKVPFYRWLDLQQYIRG